MTTLPDIIGTGTGTRTKAAATASPDPMGAFPAPVPYPRRFGAAALAAAPVALLLSDLLNPGTNDSRQLISDASHHATAIAVADGLLLLSSLLFLPGAFALVAAVRGRGRRLVAAGAGLLTLGALGHAVFVGFESVVLSTPQGDPSQMVALLDRLNTSPALAPVALAIAAFALSLPLLAFGAWRARLVPLAAPLLVMGAVLIEVAHVGAAGSAVKELLATAAFAWIAWALARRTS